MEIIKPVFKGYLLGRFTTKLYLFASILVYSLLSFSSANAGTFTVFGSHPFERGTGNPFTVTENFTVFNPNTTYTLNINNNQVTSASVLVNGTQIFGPSNFKHKTNFLSKNVTLIKNNQLSVQLKSKPGSNVSIEVIGVDNELPEITAVVTPKPDTNGWNTTPVTVSFKCFDKISDIKFCSSPVVVNNEGAGQVITGTAVDNAGNTATTSVTLNIDTVKPTINYKLTPIPNAAGWSNSDVIISFDCSDASSGIKSCSSPITVNTEGSNQLFTGTAVDKAGNSNTVSIALDVDKTLPTVNSIATPAANSNGWNNTDVTVDFVCSDNLSGIASCSPSQKAIAEGLNQVITGTAVDKAGNSANSTVTLNIDRAAPTITASVSPASNTAGWHGGDVVVSFVCLDALSGVGTCPTPINVNSEGAGQIITGTAVDKAGNQATTSVTLNIDKTAPTLTVTSPASGSALSVNPPEIKLSYSDNVAVEPSSLLFSLNGQALSVQCQSTATSATCTPTAAFTTASVTLTISVKDSVGNNASTQVTYSVDSDADGVPDASDQCSNTPTGETVDSDGCSASQRDADSDGINDTVDQCPATFSGVEVDNVGCSAAQRDSDDDGVSDALDECAASSKGETVNALGCSATQRDTDADGVNDATDICPGTSNGIPIDNFGCSGAQNDIDGDGVPNEQDKFPTNPKESTDLDGDGIGDNSDPDIDGDGVANELDAYPSDPSKTLLPVVKIDSPATLTTVGISPIEVKGSVDTAGTLTVNGVVVTPVDGLYTASVNIEEGHNTIVTRLVAADGVISTASISVSLDLTPPYVTLESHTDGQIVRTSTVAISGLVNDIVRGTVEDSQANVTVNGIQASISNRSYLAKDIPLTEGENLLKIVGADQVSNTLIKNITLIYKPTIGKHLEIAGGQDQTALINDVLPNPLSIKVLDDNDQPVANKNVVFRVIQGSGILGIDTDLVGRGVVVKTNELGIASTKFQLGQRSGTGNHKVRARVVGYEDEIIFYASATANIGDKLSVNSGNNQRGGTHQQLPAPFVIAVTDAGTNVVKSARVRFDVIHGGGHFENDTDTITVVTDSDGRASAHLTLGGVTGLDKQTILATLLDGPEGQNITAGFSASGFTPGDAGATTISGIVVDNQDKPIPGVTIRVDGTTRQAVADQSGQFNITEVPVGPVHLIADGSTATVEGEFPSLSYNIVTVSGVENPLASPIYMVKLDTENAVYAGLKDVEVTLPEVPGFKLEIPAGSVTFPDGSKEGQISVTAVNANKIPMAPPNGMQPQFIVTIQPTGAKFDPPAPLTLPNVDGHTPGAQVEMFSYDHDLEEFVAIGLGTVSEDGRVIKTNTGVGVIKAGWHCGAQPGGDGCCSGPSECDDYCATANEGCDAGCSIDESKALEEQSEGDCATATCGGSEDDLGDIPEEEFGDCKANTCEPGGPATIDDPSDTPDTDTPNDCKQPGCEGGIPKDQPDDGDKPTADSDIEFDCKKPGCEKGETKDELDASDISADDEKCSKCSEEGVVPDTAKDKKACGNGSPEESCLVCDNGSCEVPECEAEKGKRTTSFGNSYLSGLVKNVGDSLSKSPFVNVSLGGVRIEGFVEEGQECCKDCSKPPEPVNYRITGGRATGIGYIVAVVPGFGLAQKLPEKVYLGFLKVDGVVEFGLGGRGTVSVKGSYESKSSECVDDTCSTVSVTGSGSVFVGVLAKAKLNVKSCIDADNLDCTKVAAIGGESNSGFTVSASATAKTFIGDSCTSGGCVGYSIGGIDFVANVKGNIEVGIIKKSYSAEVKVNLSDPISSPGRC